MEFGIEVFATKALVLGHLMRTWAFLEPFSHQKIDGQDEAFSLWGRCDDDVTPRGRFGPPTRIIKRCDDPLGVYSFNVLRDNVVMFANDDEVDAITPLIEEAYRIYCQSQQTEADWEAFEVTIRLMI